MDSDDYWPKDKLEKQISFHAVGTRNGEQNNVFISNKKLNFNDLVRTSQELRMLSPSLCIQRSHCNCSHCCSQLSEM